MNSKVETLASNTIIFAVGSLIVKLISFFLMPLYTSVLTAEEYGVAELLNNTIEIVLPIVTLCIIEAIYRFAIDIDADKDSLFTSALFVIIIGDIILVASCLIINAVFDYPFTYHFLFLYLSMSFYKLTTQFARGLNHVKRYALYGIINSLFLVLFNILLLVVRHGGISAYLYSFSFSYGITGLLAFFISKEYLFVKISSFSVRALKDMLRYSLPSIPNLLSWWVNSLSDRYLVLLFCGPGVAGLYTAASKLPAMINVFTSIFQQAWQYSTAVEINNSDSNSFFSIIFRAYSYFCISICALLLCFNKLICKILLQSTFYSAWRFIPLLLLAATFGCIGTYFGTFYNAIKNNKMLMLSTLIGALLNIVLNLVLIPTIGAMGAAIATGCSYFTIMVIRLIDVKKIVNLDINILRFVFQLVVLFIASVIGSFDYPWVLPMQIVLALIVVLSDLYIFNRCIIGTKNLVRDKIFRRKGAFQ